MAPAPAVGSTAPTTPVLKHPPPAPPGLGLPPHVAAKQQAAAEHQRKQHQPLAVQQAAPAPAGGGTAPAQAAPAPAVGGAAPVFVPSDIPAVGARRLGGAAPVFVPSGIPVGPASSWSINDMVTYLDAIALGHLNPIIRDNRLDGVFFLQCAQEDLH